MTSKKPASLGSAEEEPSNTAEDGFWSMKSQTGVTSGLYPLPRFNTAGKQNGTSLQRGGPNDNQDVCLCLSPFILAAVLSC